MVEATQTLYHALGEDVGIRSVVDDFYGRVLADPQLSPYFASVDMTAVRRHQVAFLSAATGGPKQYSGRTLSDAHARLGVTGEAFERVVTHLVASLDVCGVDAETTSQVVSALAPLRPDIVTSD
jgi:hemoglobin